jgi:hypothetical protein
MKKLAAILFPLFYLVAAHAQVLPWGAFPVDAAVTLRVPGKPQPVAVNPLPPNLPPKQARGYRYTDIAGTYTLMRLEKPLDKRYAKDADHAFYSDVIDLAMHNTRGTLLDEAILMHGPYTAACARYNVPGKGTQYLGIVLLHQVSYEFQYTPSRPLSKDQDAQLWAQFQQSIVSLK